MKVAGKVMFVAENVNFQQLLAGKLLFFCRPDGHRSIAPWRKNDEHADDSSV